MSQLPPLQICHLYPQHMALYGDRGNIITLCYRARERGLEVQVQCCGPQIPIEGNPQIIVLGGGQDQDQERVVQDLLSRRGQLQDLIQGGSCFLGICGGFQFLGNYYETVQATIEGLQLLDLVTKRAIPGQSRIIGNLKAVSPQFGFLWGFENHGGRTFLGEGVRPLARVEEGGGNNGLDGTEGVFQQLGRGRIIGSYLHSFLPRNPQVADYLIQTALGLEELSPLDDHWEQINRAVGAKLRY